MLNAWRDCDLFTERERAALAWTESLTRLSETHAPDDVYEMVSAQFYELRRRTIRKARDLKESAELHRRVYRAIRARDREAARATMTEHLEKARHAQTLERDERESR